MESVIFENSTYQKHTCQSYRTLLETGLQKGQPNLRVDILGHSQTSLGGGLGVRVKSPRLDCLRAVKHDLSSEKIEHGLNIRTN